MKLHKVLIICILSLLNCKNSNADYDRKSENVTYNMVPKEYIGRYTVYTQTEQTSTGMASITYSIKINKSNAYLETQTYHEPIRCNGNYRVVNKKSYIALYYNGKDSLCKSPDPDFKIKKDNDKFFIKGVGNEVASLYWKELKKVN